MTKNPGITRNTLDFLSDLMAHNDRNWFEANKSRFLKAQKETRAFFAAVMERLGRHDEIDRFKPFRIYRDVRFSADKTPYKPHFAGSYSRAGARLRGGYYIRIRPGESFAAVGFWAPEAPDLLRIRKELEQDAAPFRKVVGSAGLKDSWGILQGDAVKTAPKGFDRNHPDIGLIRMKQFLFSRPISDAEVLEADFADRLDMHYRAIRPWFDLMSEILTTNLDGESLLDG